MILNNKLIFEISPLITDKYTGISNVVYELAKRFLNDTDVDVTFCNGSQILKKAMIQSIIEHKSCKKMPSHLFGEKLNHSMVDVPILFSNVKNTNMAFNNQFQIVYDLSPFLTPECHHKDNVHHHTKNFEEDIQQCKGLITISHSVEKHLNTYFGLSHIKTSYLGIGHDITDTEQLQTRLDSHNLAVEPYLLILGTIEPRKNISLVLRWLQHDKSILERYRLIIIGNDGWNITFQDLIQEYGLEADIASGRIKRLGYIDDKQKENIVKFASALIFPSFFEGFGLPLLEAMSLKTPVISSCSSSLPEVLGEHGFYFNPECIDSLKIAFEQFEQKNQDGSIESMITDAYERSKQFSYNQFYQDVKNYVLQIS